jgi:hypothetical protein
MPRKVYRWTPVQKDGCFVAREWGGDIIVAPMNADGTRSIYDDELVVLDPREFPDVHAEYAGLLQ